MYVRLLKLPKIQLKNEYIWLGRVDMLPLWRISGWQSAGGRAAYCPYWPTLHTKNTEHRGLHCSTQHTEHSLVQIKFKMIKLNLWYGRLHTHHPFYGGKYFFSYLKNRSNFFLLYFCTWVVSFRLFGSAQQLLQYPAKMIHHF